MTNHIEEMMRTAGVKPKYFVKGDIKGAFVKGTFPTKKDAKIYQSEFGGNLTKEYDFTAKKQLEIIKLIMKIEHLTLIDREISITSMKNKPIGMWCKDATGYSEDFSQALAQLTTELMNVEELDKEKVKEVLQ